MPFSNLYNYMSEEYQYYTKMVLKVNAILNSDLCKTKKTFNLPYMRLAITKDQEGMYDHAVVSMNDLRVFLIIKYNKEDLTNNDGYINYDYIIGGNAEVPGTSEFAGIVISGKKIPKINLNSSTIEEELFQLSTMYSTNELDLLLFSTIVNHELDKKDKYCPLQQIVHRFKRSEFKRIHEGLDSLINNTGEFS
ncbi:TPA: hypothetical protein OGU99_000553 [Escherichia coli]|nr:hypothetical protein [Escherichia coli]